MAVKPRLDYDKFGEINSQSGTFVTYTTSKTRSIWLALKIADKLYSIMTIHRDDDT